VFAARRGWEEDAAVRDRVRGNAEFRAEKNIQHQHGFLYHFINGGKPASGILNSEVSPIDHLSYSYAAPLTCRAYLMTRKLRTWRQKFYERIDWTWILHGGAKRFSMGWIPEQGFLKSRMGHLQRN